MLLVARIAAQRIITAKTADKRSAEILRATVESELDSGGVMKFSEFIVNARGVRIQIDGNCTNIVGTARRFCA